MCVALGGPTEEELLELLDQCDLALTRTPDMSPAASLTHSSRNSTCRYTHTNTRVKRKIKAGDKCFTGAYYQIKEIPIIPSACQFLTS